MLNKFIITVIFILSCISAVVAQPDSTTSWHLQWQYASGLVDTGLVDNFVIKRLNSQTAEEKQILVQKNAWQVIGSDNGNSIFQEADTGLKPGIIYAYTVYAASSDTLTSAASNVAEGAIPMIVSANSVKIHVDTETGLSSGTILYSLINPLEETFVRSYKKEVHSPSGGTISGENLTSSSFTFNSTMDSGEVAYIDITVINADTSKAFFYTKRVTLLFTSDQVDEPVETSTPIVAVTANTAQIIWQTNVPSRDHIIYGPGHDKTLQSATDQTAITNHERTLSGLQPATLYYFQIVSNTATSGPYTSQEYQFLTDELAGTERKSRIFPGKFIASQHSQINFYNIPDNGSVTIYSWLGDVVYEQKNLAAGDFAWDVKNPSGKNISSGFYLYFIQDGQGKVEAQGKFIVIR